MSMSSSSSSTEVVPISTKPWSLTYNSLDKEVFIWKNGLRLKVSGVSVGPVERVSPFIPSAGSDSADGDGPLVQVSSDLLLTMTVVKHIERKWLNCNYLYHFFAGGLILEGPSLALGCSASSYCSCYSYIY